MLITNYTQFRKNLSNTMNAVIENHEPIIITRDSSASAVVMLSLEDFNQYQETTYLAKSPANKKRLLQSVKNLGDKKYAKKALLK